ncbi:uncharacterized WD repeat-containing protein-like protein isoform X1 [Tanacetum coccineum]
MYSFASAWHPDGRVFATGNQDRVYDLRNLSNPVSILKGNMGTVWSVRFSSNGQFLMVAEPADFGHVYETNKNYEKRQEIDIFGEISGVSLSPDDETLYVGVWDPIGVYDELRHGVLCKTLTVASTWHPDGRVFATGNNDKTCRVWDLRNLANTVFVLKESMGAVRSSFLFKWAVFGGC